MKTIAKKSTIYFDPQIHKALRLKAAETDSSVSDIVNEAIRIVFAEDAEDMAAFAERAHEPNMSFEEVLKDLKRRGKDISVSVENITPFGIWLYVKEKEYFLSYKDYPYFKDQILGSIQNVQLLHGYHLYWPDLDVDLEIDNLESPEKYPLQFKTNTHLTKKSGGRRIAAV
jgi:hypothetical protein